MTAIDAGVLDDLAASIGKRIESVSREVAAVGQLARVANATDLTAEARAAIASAQSRLTAALDAYRDAANAIPAVTR